MEKKNIKVLGNEVTIKRSLLVDFMKKHEKLAKTQLQKDDQGRQLKKKLREKLTLQLNSNGPPIKSTSDWSRVWTDFKQRSKNKLSFNKKSLSKTGGGPYDQMLISDLEQDVIECSGIDASVEGIPGTSKFGADMCIPSNCERMDTSAEIATLQQNFEDIIKDSDDGGSDELNRDEFDLTKLKKKFNIIDEPVVKKGYLPKNNDLQSEISKVQQRKEFKKNYNSEFLDNLQETEKISLIQKDISNRESFQNEMLATLKDIKNEQINFQNKISSFFDEFKNNQNDFQNKILKNMEKSTDINEKLLECKQLAMQQRYDLEERKLQIYAEDVAVRKMEVEFRLSQLNEN